MAKSHTIFFIIYLIFGLYFIDYAFNLLSINFLVLPSFLNNVNPWIILIGGILVLIGGINYLRLAKYKF